VAINALDLSEEKLKTKIVLPYLSGEPFLFKGRPIDPVDLESVHIYRTEKAALAYLDFINDEYNMFASRGSVWKYIPSIGKDVTEDFITTLPKETKTAGKPLSKSSVFIVHGRDHKPVNQLKAMLAEFGLNPIVLHEQPSGSRTIVEKLEKYSDVGYAFVILTPDDVGCLNVRVSKSLKSVVKTLQNLVEAYTVIKRKGPLKKARDELARVISYFKPRARQNVVLEFGFFMGLLGRDRVCCLYKGDIELPSDMHGIVYIPFKESVNEVRGKIVKELKTAGYEIELRGIPKTYRPRKRTLVLRPPKKTE